MTVLVQDPNGQRVADAVIEPESYQLPNGSFSADVPEGMTTYVPPEILKLVRAKTNSAGSAELNCFSAQLVGDLRAISDAYGTQLFGPPSNLNWRIQLRPVGSLKVKLVGADAAQTKGCILNIRAEPWKQNKLLATSSGMTQVDIDGRSEFVIPKLVDGRLTIGSWSWRQRDKYLPSRNTDADIVAGAETVVELKLVPSVEVSGRLLLQDSLQPAKGVSLSIQSSAAYTDSAKTDDQGNFKLYALPGPAQISFNAPGPNTARSFRLPMSRKVVVPSASPLIVPDIVLEKRLKLTVHISDAMDNP